MSLASPTELPEPNPPSASRRQAPSLGSRPPSRHQPTESTSRGHPKPTKFRPRSFSLPRRFTPPLALRVYFTPQPRPGFTLQGFSLRRSRTIFRWPLPSCRSTAAPVAGLRQPRQNRSPAYRALLRVGVRSAPQGFSLRPTRSPPGFHLPRVLRLTAVQSPSRPLRS